MLKVRVLIYASEEAFDNFDAPIHSYVMDHDNTDSRRVLGAQCRYAFEAGQVVATIALKPKRK